LLFGSATGAAAAALFDEAKDMVLFFLHET
jgi:hypothetical protein